MNSDKSERKLGLVGRHLTVLDLKTSCRALSASVRWTKTICRGSRVPQPMRNCHESHMNKPLFKHSGDRLGPRLNAVSRDKKSASVRQTDVPTNFSPIWPRQKICSSATKNRLVCGSLKGNSVHDGTCWRKVAILSSLSLKIRFDLPRSLLFSFIFDLLWYLGCFSRSKRYYFKACHNKIKLLSKKLL